MNLSNYFFITDSIVFISTTHRLLALHFMHEIRDISDVRFMPEISLDKCLTLNSTDISPWNYNSVMKLFGYVQKLQMAHLIPLKTINTVSYNTFSKPRPGRAGPVFRLDLKKRWALSSQSVVRTGERDRTYGGKDLLNTLHVLTVSMWYNFRNISINFLLSEIFLSSN